MSRLTIRWRVTIVAVAVLAFALVVLALIGNFILVGRLRSDSDSILRNRAAAQIATLARVNGKVVVRESVSDAALDEQAWVFADGKAIEESRAAPEVRAAVDRLATVGKPTFLTLGERVKLYARPAYSESGGRVGTVVVGVSWRPYEHSKHIARYGMLVLSIFVLLAAAAAIYWAVGRALAPVDEMTKRASDWSEHDLHRRFGLGEPRDEITALAATLDTLLERIDSAMQREQRVTAEIAHELRTPLASVRAEAELELRDAEGKEQAALTRIVGSADRMNAAIETLLAAHRGDVPAGLSCDPAVAATEAVDAFREARHDKTWNVVATPGDSLVEVDKAVLVQTLAPMLDNAGRHATKTVDVSVKRDHQTVVIAICDDGAGLSEASQRDIFAAGVSNSERAGLGLPLAKRLAQSFGAELAAVSDAAGGRFELRMSGRKPA